MMNWYKSESIVRPDEVDITSSKKVVYLRRNIVERQREDEISGETVTYYEYDEAKLSRTEYEVYLKETSNYDWFEPILKQHEADIYYISLMMGVKL